MTKIEGKADAFGRNLAKAAGSPVVNAATFFLFVVTGWGYIVLAKLFHFGAVLVTFVPVAIMFSYAALVGLVRALRLRDDQSGDNLYYMGFLFTLASLGVSLFQFSTADTAAEEIVQNFGVAIASTIAGVALRVFFNQLRRDPIEVERIARLELAEAARRVRRELDATVVEFAYFRRSAQQVIMEGFDEVRAQVDVVAAKLLSGLEELTAKSAAPLEAASKHSGQTIEDLTKTTVAALEASARDLAAQTEQLSKSAAAIAMALDDVSTKLGTMQTPDRVVEIRIAPVVQDLARAVDQFTAQAATHSDEIKHLLEGTKTATAQSSDVLASVRDGAAAHSEEVREMLHGTRNAIDNAFEALKAIQQRAGVNEDLVSGTLDRAQQAAHAMSAAAASFKDGADAQAVRLQRVLEKSDENMAAFSELMKRISSDDARRISVPQELVPTSERSGEASAAVTDQATISKVSAQEELIIVGGSAA